MAGHKSRKAMKRECYEKAKVNYHVEIQTEKLLTALHSASSIRHMKMISSP